MKKALRALVLGLASVAASGCIIVDEEDRCGNSRTTILSPVGIDTFVTRRACSRPHPYRYCTSHSVWHSCCDHL